MNTWVLNGKSLPFPQTWDKKKVLSFINEGIRVCPFCNKVDVLVNHFEKCNAEKLPASELDIY